MFEFRQTIIPHRSRGTTVLTSGPYSHRALAFIESRPVFFLPVQCSFALSGRSPAAAPQLHFQREPNGTVTILLTSLAGGGCLAIVICPVS